MKKVLITLGFAAATIMAANAQETPAAEEQPQNTVQTQPDVQDETLDTDTQLMDDRTLNDSYDTETAEPGTENVRDEINQTPTEPMQDEVIDETPLLEEPAEETDAYDQPSTTSPVDPSVTPPNATNSSSDSQGSVEAPVDEMQEDVVEMQGENPDAQSSMQDVPSQEADDQSYSSTQDQGNPDAATGTEPMTQPADQSEPMQSEPQDDSALSQDTQDSEEDESVKTISESELPQEVSQAFQDSEYANATIEKVYLLEEEAVNKLMQNNAEQIYAGDQNPDKIYQLQVKSDEGQNILYYDEEGDLIGSASI